MYNKYRKVASSGFTLIEIIASIAIIGMLIAVLLPVFPQIIQWVNKTDEQLVASNLLSQVSFDIQNDIELFNGLNINYCGTGESTTMDYGTYLEVYNVKLYVCLEERVDLYRTNIKILSTNNKLLSETYTYIGEDNE